MSKKDYLPGEDAQPGDTVTSRWSSSGAHWIVVDLFDYKWGRPGANIRSVSSGRIDTRGLSDLVVVKRA